jgi:biopolymer transport protein ExbB/TolQ
MMQFFAVAFREGGIWMYLVLLFSFLHAVPVLAQLIACKKADFSGYLWAGLLGILLMGFLGTVVGCVQMFEALAVAMPEQRGSLMAAGFAISLYPTIFAILMVIPGTFFSGIAASLARNLAPRRARQPKQEV